MIIVDSLDPRDKEGERNPKLVEESKIEEIKLFGEFNTRLVKVRKNLLEGFK